MLSVFLSLSNSPFVYFTHSLCSLSLSYSTFISSLSRWLLPILIVFLHGNATWSMVRCSIYSIHIYLFESNMNIFVDRNMPFHIFCFSFRGASQCRYRIQLKQITIKHIRFRFQALKGTLQTLLSNTKFTPYQTNKKPMKYFSIWNLIQFSFDSKRFSYLSLLWISISFIFSFYYLHLRPPRSAVLKVFSVFLPPAYSSSAVSLFPLHFNTIFCTAYAFCFDLAYFHYRYVRQQFPYFPCLIPFTYVNVIFLILREYFIYIDWISHCISISNAIYNQIFHTFPFGFNFRVFYRFP